ncbi:cytochrome P450, partial [Rhizopogon vinicolor AM-OR11-026]
MPTRRGVGYKIYASQMKLGWIRAAKQMTSELKSHSNSSDPSLSFSPSIMFQLPDLHISDNTQLVLGAAACLGVVGVITGAYIQLEVNRSESGLPLPPSPPTWRLWGHFLPSRTSFLTIGEWIGQYGPLITIRVGTEKIVIIGRHKAAVDIMEKEGEALADRPRMIAVGEMLSGGLLLGLIPVGDRFRRMRRVLHTHLQPKAAETYQPMQMSQAKKTVLDILDDPYDFHNHVITCAATTVMKIAYGKDTPTTAADPAVKTVRQSLDKVHIDLRPGGYLVDTIPWLKYLPFYGLELRLAFMGIRRHYTSQLNIVKQQLQSNTDVVPSFAKFILENGPSYGITELEAAFLAGGIFGAGFTTTSSAICTVLLAAACFPEEQAKVQDELDAVIGRHQAPTFADQESLPCLQAFIYEALRWRPGPIANGFAHRTTKDVIWENYCIPAGTTVFGNHW